MLGMLSRAGGSAIASEKLSSTAASGAADEPAGVSENLSALSLSGQEAMNTLNTLCKSAAEGSPSTSGPIIPGACRSRPQLFSWL